jgi:hypothetical protein
MVEVRFVVGTITGRTATAGATMPVLDGPRRVAEKRETSGVSQRFAIPGARPPGLVTAGRTEYFRLSVKGGDVLFALGDATIEVDDDNGTPLAEGAVEYGAIGEATHYAIVDDV